MVLLRAGMSGMADAIDVADIDMADMAVAGSTATICVDLAAGCGPDMAIGARQPRLAWTVSRPEPDVASRLIAMAENEPEPGPSWHGSDYGLEAAQNRGRISRT